MTNEEAAEILKLYNKRLDESCSNLLDRDKEAFDLAIKALLRFRHVIIVHPKYGECDGWYDEERHLLFHCFVTKEFADRHGWKIKEEEE